MEYVFILIGIGIYALRILIPIIVARVMWKKKSETWKIVIAVIAAIFIPWLGLIYLIINRFREPGIPRL
jgi:4-amino-4-deoxy-L-arabinose transferase-like glycosyltransferase